MHASKSLVGSAHVEVWTLRYLPQPRCCCWASTGAANHASHPTLSSFCTGQTILSHCILGTTEGNRLRITRLQNCQQQYYGSTPDDCTNPMAVCDDDGNVVDLNCSGQDTQGTYMEPYSQLLCREVWPCPADVLHASLLGRVCQVAQHLCL